MGLHRWSTIEQRSNRFRLIFYYLGRRHAASPKNKVEREADAIAGGVDRTLMLLEQGVLTPGGGRPGRLRVLAWESRGEAQTAAAHTLGELRDRYFKAHELGAMEENSLDTVRMHLRHLARTLGPCFAVASLEKANA